MLQLPPGLLEQVNDPEPAHPFLWCWQIDLATVGDKIYTARLVNHDQVVQLAPGLEFDPFPIAHSQIEQNSDGDLPEIGLTIDNRTRFLSRFLHQAEGFVDNEVVVYLLSAANPSEAEALSFRWRVVGAELNADAISLRLEAGTNFFDRLLPQGRFSAYRCPFLFGGPECGYPINQAAAYTDCGKSLEDCILRGEDEALRRIPVLHPQRFGGFRGIPASRR